MRRTRGSDKMIKIKIGSNVDGNKYPVCSRSREPAAGASRSLKPREWVPEFESEPRVSDAAAR